MCCAGSLAGCLVAALLWSVAPAQATSFTDPAARVFSLSSGTPALGPDIGRLRALPNGDVLFVADLDDDLGAGTLHRLGLDGRIERLAWAGRLTGLAVDRSGTVLVVRRGHTTIEHLDLTTRRRRALIDLVRAGVPRRAVIHGVAFAALGRGRFAVIDGTEVIQVAPETRARRTALKRVVFALAPMSDGAYTAIVDGGLLVRIEPEGRRHVLARDAAGGLATMPDGRVVAGMRSGIAIVDDHGRIERLPWSIASSAVPVEGQPASATPWQPPRSMTVAADGSLILAVESGLRGLVPSGSPRPRVGIVSVAELVTDGRISYVAAPRGTVKLEVFRDGTPVASTVGPSLGTGELRLSAPLAQDLYEVRLRYTGGAAQAVTSGRAGIRTTLTRNELIGALASGDMDLVDRVQLYDCTQPTPASGECLIAMTVTAPWSEGPDSVIRTETPWGRGLVNVGPDGLINVQISEFGLRDAAPTLRTELLRTRPFDRALRAPIVSALNAHATVEVFVGPREDVSIRLRTVAQALDARERWTPSWSLSVKQRATVEAWLDDGHRVYAWIRVTLVRDVGVGFASTIVQQPMRLTR